MGTAGFHWGGAGMDAGGADSLERGSLEQVSQAGSESHLGCQCGEIQTAVWLQFSFI